MPTEAATHYFNTVADDQSFSGEATIRKISAAAPGANTATSMTWSATGAQTRTTIPLAGSTVNSDTSQNNGWAFNDGGADGLGSVSTDKRRIPPGVWSITLNCTINAPALLATASATMTARVYRVASGGGSRSLLFSATAPAFTNGGVQAVTADVTATSSSQPEILLEAGEVIMIGFTWTGAATSATLGGTTATVVTVNLGTLGRFLVPTGVRTRRYRNSAPESLPAVDSIIRRLYLPRVLPETVAGADEPVQRSVKTGRFLVESAPAVDSLDRVLHAYRALSEDVPIGSDSTARKFVGERAPETEAIPTNDTLAAAFKGERTIAESVPTVDQTPARKFVGERQLEEDTAVEDSLERLYQAKRFPTEITTTVDVTLDRAVVLGRGLEEDIGTVDEIERKIKQRRFLTEYPTGVTPDYVVEFPEKKIAGVVKDSSGVPYEGATVKLFRAFDDKMVQQTTSGPDGEYEFLRDLYDPYTYVVMAYEEDDPATQGLTVRGLLPVDV